MTRGKLSASFNGEQKPEALRVVCADEEGSKKGGVSLRHPVRARNSGVTEPEGEKKSLPLKPKDLSVRNTNSAGTSRKGYTKEKPAATTANLLGP